MVNTVSESYEDEKVVCRPALRKAVFTTAAVDNSDHNPSSSTAKESFHDTVISLNNHLSSSSLGTPRDVTERDAESRKRNILKLPPS